MKAVILLLVFVPLAEAPCQPLSVMSICQRSMGSRCQQGGPSGPASFADAFVTDVHGRTPMVAADGSEVDSVIVLLESVFYPERVGGAPSQRGASDTEVWLGKPLRSCFRASGRRIRC